MIIQSILVFKSELIIFVPDPEKFTMNSTPADDVATINRNNVKTLLANRLSTFFISNNPVFRFIPRSLLVSPRDCVILKI